MDHAQIAFEYRKSSQTCLLRAKRGNNSVDWTGLARQWEALARLRRHVADFELCAQFGGAREAWRKRHAGRKPDEASVIPNLKTI
jgi:hypothetical protein